MQHSLRMLTTIEIKFYFCLATRGSKTERGAGDADLRCSLTDEPESLELFNRFCRTSLLPAPEDGGHQSINQLDAYFATAGIADANPHERRPCSRNQGTCGEPYQTLGSEALRQSVRSELTGKWLLGRHNPTKGALPTPSIVLVWARYHVGYEPEFFESLLYKL
jgi:hypothetical protein